MVSTSFHAYLDVHDEERRDLGVRLDLRKVEVLGDVMDLLGAGKQVNAYRIVGSVVWSRAFLLVSGREKNKNKNETRGSVRTAHACFTRRRKKNKYTCEYIYFFLAVL